MCRLRQTGLTSFEAPIKRPTFRAAVETLESRELLAGGFGPNQISHAYGVDQIALTGAGQTIGIVVAHHDPFLEADVATFNARYGLPPASITTVHVGADVPTYDVNWALEEALDVEYAHAMAPGAKILVSEAPGATIYELMFAAGLAQYNGAHVVSMSFGGQMAPFERGIDPIFNRPTYTFVAASGDSPVPYYPSSAPGVTSVGGTTLTLDANGIILSETPWPKSGGGITTLERTPAYQHGHRGRKTPDLGFVGDPHTGVSVYSTGYGWVKVGGTSIGAPAVAGIVTLANEGRARIGKAPLGPLNPALYAAPRSMFRPSVGLGSPRAERLIPYLISYRGRRR